MGAADGLHARLREAEVLDLALLDQLLDRARDVLDRDVRVDAVLVEEVDRSRSGGVAASRRRSLRIVSGRLSVPRDWPVEKSKPNFVAITTWSRTGSSASPTSCSFVNGP